LIIKWVAQYRRCKVVSVKLKFIEFLKRLLLKQLRLLLNVLEVIICLSDYVFRFEVIRLKINPTSPRINSVATSKNKLLIERKVVSNS
jgi:hypothetical protein